MRAIFAIGLSALVLAGSAQVAQAQPPGGGGPGGGFNMMERLDADKDGKISLAEYTSFAQARWGRFSQGADKVKVADIMPMQQNAVAGITPDADGYVTKAAYEAAIPAKFKAADTNGDGSLSEAEFMATMPMMRRPAQ